MKILLCANSYCKVVNGPAKFAQIVSMLGHEKPDTEVRVLTEDSECDETGNVFSIGFSYPRLVNSLGKYIRMVGYHFEAMKIRMNYKFEVLMYNDAIQGYFSTLFKPRGVKVVVLLNDSSNLEVTWRDISFSRKWVIRMLHRAFERRAIMNSDLTLCCSDDLRQLVQSYYNCSENVKTLYQCVDLLLWSFKTKKGNIDKYKTKVLFVKCNFKIGGLQYLIEALSKLNEWSFELMIVGPLELMYSEVEALYLPVKNIDYKLIGSQPQKIIKNMMYEADILCIPSISESLGVANIEGLATGISVVSTQVGGIPEVLGKEEFGWLAKPRDPDHLAMKIRDCLTNPAEAREKSRLGRIHVERNFGQKMMLERLYSYLKALN